MVFPSILLIRFITLVDFWMFNQSCHLGYTLHGHGVKWSFVCSQFDLLIFFKKFYAVFMRELVCNIIFL